MPIQSGFIFELLGRIDFLWLGKNLFLLRLITFVFRSKFVVALNDYFASKRGLFFVNFLECLVIFGRFLFRAFLLLLLRERNVVFRVNLRKVVLFDKKKLFLLRRQWKRIVPESFSYHRLSKCIDS